jgi:hypothetical protein
MNELLCLSVIINAILLYNIISLTYIHLLEPLYFFIALGIITSIINHSISNFYLKYFDRFVITLSAIVLFIYIYYFSCDDLLLLFLFLAIAFYLFSKLFGSYIIKNLLHSTSHFIITATIYLLSANLYADGYY